MYKATGRKTLSLSAGLKKTVKIEGQAAIDSRGHTGILWSDNSTQTGTLLEDGSFINDAVIDGELFLAPGNLSGFSLSGRTLKGAPDLSKLQPQSTALHSIEEALSIEAVLKKK